MERELKICYTGVVLALGSMAGMVYAETIENYILGMYLVGVMALGFALMIISFVMAKARESQEGQPQGS